MMESVQTGRPIKEMKAQLVTMSNNIDFLVATARV